MDVLLMGQLLLGCLLAMAFLMNGLLLRLGWRLRQSLSEAALSLNALLLWAPMFLLLVVIGGAAFAWFNLFTFRDAQDTSGVSWFMLGTCLVIFADVCSAFILIRLKETRTMARSANDPEMLLFPLGTSEHSDGEKQAEE